jgi:hypothetical protein
MKCSYCGTENDSAYKGPCPSCPAGAMESKQPIEFTKYDGESKTCLIQYGDKQIKVGYTVMHNLVSHIDSRGMTYGADLGSLQDALSDIRNQMGADSEKELDAVKDVPKKGRGPLWEALNKAAGNLIDGVADSGGKAPTKMHGSMVPKILTGGSHGKD